MNMTNGLKKPWLNLDGMKTRLKHRSSAKPSAKTWSENDQHILLQICK